MSVERAPIDLDAADDFAMDLADWVRSQSTSQTASRFRSDLRRYLRRYVGTWHDQTLSVDHATGARGVDYVVGDQIAIVLIESITEGSNHWLYRELGTIGQQYEYVVVIGNDLTEEHVDIWRSLARRMTNRSSSTFRFLAADELLVQSQVATSPVRTVNGFLGVGAAVISFAAIAVNSVMAFTPTDPMAGAFAGAVFVLFGTVLAFCLFFVVS
ncbi:hypothetical protein C479_11030 [Halovivax asiaticus JCM 14624]|uniref:Uncharacterized protein n=1 Tax=Halovivax asiaticus JCM 14624 TaxID=1227490 RepID=M0BET1_9EURY|nr:hypothetical protein [Halovivax asiaticus]ELZ09350.1 hypothetical protein C479_11030 [Halovivax asiaticus JCM 14624]